MSVYSRWIAPAPPVPALPLEGLGDYPSSLVADVLGGTPALNPRIRLLSGGPRLVGVALTAEVPPGDNLFLFQAVAMMQPGHVLVVNAHAYPGQAVWGGNLMAALKARGGRGVVVDGYVRDLEELAASGLPVFAIGTCPNRPTRRGPGRLNYPIWCGERWVEPGDIVVGDADGVVVVPQAALERLRTTLPQAARADAERAQPFGRGQIPAAILDELRARGFLGQDGWSPPAP
jgi:4-hydroxy-4-methyl-2-oxoglutarate aldolase